MRDLENRTIVLAITGGIAAYKCADLTRGLRAQGANVQVIMSEAATQFITPLTMQALSGQAVYVSQWDGRINNHMPHIDLTRNADAVIVAPASADCIAKLAQGLCDDLVTTLCLARTCPLLVAPAMNQQMWSNPATQRNINQLRQDEITILGPASGAQACGETGPGRMLEPDEIVVDVIGFFQPRCLKDQRVLITAGPTFEPIDAVRGITNLSSGKMGYALARAAREAGAKVTLISGPTALAAPYGVRCAHVQTAQQMLDEVMAYVDHAHIFISVAAVADWRVRQPSTEKAKKNTSPPSLDFVANPDILATVAALPRPPYCVGFAAETSRLNEYAQAKRKQKGVPLLIGNLVPDALGSDQSALVLYDDAGITPLVRAAKLTLARQVIQAIAQRQS